MISSPTPDALARAAKLLRAGKLVAFPTETVYGLGADACNEHAVRAIFATKGRPADHPVIVHVKDVDDAARWARAMPRGARALAEAFWPGPLTIIVPRAADVPGGVTGGQDNVGLRVPSHPVAQALLQAFAAEGGRGIAAPSANRFGRISPTTAQHVRDDLGDDVAMIVDGGACDVGIESTIVAFTGDDAVLLRPGGIAEAQLARVLGAPLRAPRPDAPRASGTLASHYAPRTPSRLVAADELPSDARVAVLARTAAPRKRAMDRRAARRRRVRARPVCEPARARRHGRERNRDRGRADGRSVARGARPARARDARRARRDGLGPK
jgi:L-threonylcarbamoyladenylate synthase